MFQTIIRNLRRNSGISEPNHHTNKIRMVKDISEVAFVKIMYQIMHINYERKSTMKE